MSRKQSRFAYWLVWCGLTVSPFYVYAQNFDPVDIGANLNEAVDSGGVTNVQFSQLQQLEIESFLATDQAQNYYELNFNPDGFYGELKNGAIVDDWETLAKAMGTSGAVLAGGYGIWRQRRRSELFLLRGGDTKAIEALFQSDFIDEEDTQQNNDGSSSFFEASIPKTTEQWEEWGKTKGLPGVGASLAALFLIWRRKKEPIEKFEHVDIYESLYQDGESYRDFYANVWSKNHSLVAAKKAEILADLEKPGLNEFFGIEAGYQKYKSMISDQNLPYAERESALSKYVENLYREREYLRQTGGSKYRMSWIQREVHASSVSLYGGTAKAIALINTQNQYRAEITAGNTAYQTALRTYNQAFYGANTTAYNTYKGLMINFSKFWNQKNQEFRDSGNWTENLQALKKNTNDHDSFAEKERSALLTETIATFGSVFTTDHVNALINDETVEFEVGHSDREKFIKVLHNDVHDLGEAKTKSVNQIWSLLKVINTLPDHPYTGVVKNLMKSITDGSIELGILQQNLAEAQKFDYAQIASLEGRITQVELAMKDATKEITDYYTWFMTNSGETLVRATSAVAVATNFQATKYENHEIYQFVAAEKARKDFFLKYGHANKDEYLAAKKGIVGEQIKENSLRLSRMFGYEASFTPIRVLVENLKNQYEILEKGELADFTLPSNAYHSWSSEPYRNDVEYSALNRQYQDRKSWAGINDVLVQEFKQQMDEREAVIFAARQELWDAEQTKNLNDHFTSEEIADYESLEAVYKTVNSKSEALAEATKIVEELKSKANPVNLVYRSSVQTVSETKKAEIVTIEAVRTVSLKDLTQVSVTLSAGAVESVDLNGDARDVLIEAYRSAYKDSEDFVMEVERMLIQKKNVEKYKMILAMGIPNPPAKTKSVRDYLEDPDRTASDIDREVAKVEAGILILEAEKNNSNTTQSRKDQLISQITQANNKIAALERYKADGPIAAAEYEQELIAYEAKYQSQLASIDDQLTVKYDLSTNLIASYYEQAKTLVAQRETEIIDTRGDIALVEQYLGQSSESPEAIAAAKKAAEDLVVAEAALATLTVQLEGERVETNEAVISQEDLTEKSNSLASISAITAGISTGTSFVKPQDYVETEAQKVAGNKDSSLTELGGAFFVGAKEQLVRELEGLAALLDWKTYWALMKSVPKLLGSMWDIGTQMIEHGPVFATRLGAEVTSVFEGDIDSIKQNLDAVKNFTTALWSDTADTTMAKGGGVAMMAVAFQVVPVGKITKADDIAPLVEKFGEAVEKAIKSAQATKVITDIRAKLLNKIDHIMKVELKGNSDGLKWFSGVHSAKAITDHQYGARIDADSINQVLKTADKPYKAKVYANDGNGNEILKSQGHGGYSTFFPDSWDKARILEEVEHAVKNNRGLDLSPNAGSNEYIGFSKDGSIQINFYYSESTGKINSFFPKITIKR